MKKLIILLIAIFCTLANTITAMPDIDLSTYFDNKPLTFEFVTTSRLNVRELPCTCARIITTLPKGCIIEVLNFEDENWAHIEYNGGNYYVCSDFIKRYNYTCESNRSYYINVDGVKVLCPIVCRTAPENATALCRDGTYSFSQHRRGTCSGHGGVEKWL